MILRSVLFTSAGFLAAALTACADKAPLAPFPAPVGVPASLQAPAGQEAFLQVRGVGVQIYECAAKAGAPGGWGWQFKAPEATLVDAAGVSVGHHYAGPTWAGNDMATVVGHVSASVPAPAKSDIPWLLLDIKSREGQGRLTPTVSVQRLDTQGGVAPTSACTEDNAKQLERVPYSATYVFWRVKAN